LARGTPVRLQGHRGGAEGQSHDIVQVWIEGEINVAERRQHENALSSGSAITGVPLEGGFAGSDYYCGANRIVLTLEANGFIFLAKAGQSVS
jgi:hypothetical protein